MSNSGIFLPKLFVIYPKTMLQINAPTWSKEVTHVACSMVILPHGNGDSSDMSRMFIGLLHPSKIPNATTKRLTKLTKKIESLKIH